MPPIPGVTEEVRDFGLGVTDPVVMTAIVYGKTSLLPPNVLNWYNSAQALRDAAGEGTATETACNILARAGGPVGVMGAATSIAAVNDTYVLAYWGTVGTDGSITRTGGTTGPAISLTGSPKLKAQFKIEIQTNGALGVGTFRWSINNGSSWVESGKLLPAGGTYALGTTGITVTFPAGSYVASEAYAWTATAGGGYLTITGTASIDAFVRFEILTGGANGTATFRYAVDGYSGDSASERTYSEPLVVPSGGTFAISSLGITVTFDDATPFVAGDYYTFSVQCATWNATDVAACFTALQATSDAWRFLVPVTSRGNGDATAHAVLTAAVQSGLTTLQNLGRHRRAMMPGDAGLDTPATCAAAYLNTVATRVLVAYGQVKRVSPKPFAGYAFPVTHGIDVFAARAASVVPSTDLKRVRSGPLAEVLKLFHNEYLTPSSLDDRKVSTLRTWDNLTGFYVTQGRLKSPSGSDFKLWPLGIVMDICCETAHELLTLSIGRAVRFTTIKINNVTYSGVIDERDAIAIEEEVAQVLISRIMAPRNAEGFDGYVTDLRFRIVRTQDVVGTGILLYEVGIKPLGYVDFVRGLFGFVRDLPAAA